MVRRDLLLSAACVALFVGTSVVGCRRSASVSAGGLSPGLSETAFIDTLEARTFGYFWDLSDPRTGLTLDRFPTKSFVSVSATGLRWIFARRESNSR